MAISVVRIAIVSGSRADAGALMAVKEALVGAGVTVRWLTVNPPKGDTREEIVHTTALVMRKMARDLPGHDLVLIHGDRYEILGVANAAFLLGLPIVHLGGGDVTEGSQDDSIRHSITKLSHLHLATCVRSAQRIIQLGEPPGRVFVTGDPGIDAFANFQPFSRENTLQALGLTTVTKYFLVAFHPNTLGSTKSELDVLIKALRQARHHMPDVGLVLLDPNKDAGHKLIEKKFRLLENKITRYHVNLPRNLYLSALTHAIALVGNSSAAYYEAPSTKTPAILLGDRQQGRQWSDNIIARVTTHEALFKLMWEMYQDRPDLSGVNPYGDGKAAARIVKILLEIKPKLLLHKHFHDL